MNGSRINDLPENGLVQSLVDARQTAKELKGSGQRVSGANIAYITTENPVTHDWSGQLNGSVPSPAYGRARFEISLTSSRAVVPMTDLAMTLFTSSDGGASWKEYTILQGIQETYGMSGVEIWRTLEVLPGFTYGPGEVKYSLDLYGRKGTRVAFKLQAVGIDEVRINVTRIY